jgi:hypothetical protein
MQIPTDTHQHGLKMWHGKTIEISLFSPIGYGHTRQQHK